MGKNLYTNDLLLHIQLHSMGTKMETKKNKKNYVWCILFRRNFTNFDNPNFDSQWLVNRTGTGSMIVTNNVVKVIKFVHNLCSNKLIKCLIAMNGPGSICRINSIESVHSKSKLHVIETSTSNLSGNSCSICISNDVEAFLMGAINKTKHWNNVSCSIYILT